MSNHVFRGYSKANLETMINKEGGNPLVSPVSSDLESGGEESNIEFR